MKRMKNRTGFTMAEVLIVVAIIGVLSSLAFVGINQYLRRLTKLEYDGYAKSIFVAAQNHLTMAEHENFMGRGGTTGFGNVEPGGDGVIRYFVVINGSETPVTESSILPLILPEGSIDGTVKSGCYIIRYHKDTAQILDVFYWTRTGRYGLEYEDNYKDFMDKRDNRGALQDYTYRSTNHAVVGYYGGVDAEDLWKNGEIIKAPSIRVINAERLYVMIKNNSDVSGISLDLIIKGNSSNAVAIINDISNADSSNTRINRGLPGINTSENEYGVILDDITGNNLHFADLTPDVGTFIPGENLTIYAVAYNGSGGSLSNVAYSVEYETNSLFEGVVDLVDSNGDPIDDRHPTDDVLDTAYIGNIRHLENLDKKVSKLGAQIASTPGLGEKFLISASLQTTDLDWKEDDAGFWITKGTITSPNGGSLSDNNYSSNFYAISEIDQLTYDGQNHSISNITSSGNDAGLFGKPTKKLSVSNLELIDFTIEGSTSAGALAGSLEDAKSGTVYGAVTNVLVRNSTENDSTYNSTNPNIKATGGNAGGLIGNSGSASISDCAAAVYVKGTTAAGGLIGSADGGTITECYSGGHTTSAAYDTINKCNVIADGTGKAGGLIGTSSATILYSYSTCSVKGKTAGGFIGEASTGSVLKNCYCTGAVDQELSGATTGAFAGALSGSAESCKYFSIINWDKDNSKTMDAVSGRSTVSGISAFDETTDSYEMFVRSGAAQASARPYDATLLGYFRSKYNLSTVEQLSGPSWNDTAKEDYFVRTHYGDWPVPEILIINEPE